MKETLGLLGGIIACSILLHYAWGVFTKKAEAQSVSSWIMWLCMDVLLVVTTYQAGKPIWLPLGWTLGALTVTISLLRDRKWVWGNKEWLSFVCAICATFVWRTHGATIGIVAGTLALTIAGIPLLIDMWENPLKSTFRVWFSTIVACACTIISSDLSFESLFLPIGSMIYNGTACILCRRNN